LLTLLVVPSFYDSIELKRDHLFAKFHAREARWNTATSVLVTALEVLMTLLLLRMFYRGALSAWAWKRGRAA
jgi:HAE1 family hydrophobic/amphiphilic exporter-1